MRFQKTRGSGFTLVEIMIVVAIIGLLVAIAIPNFNKTRANSQTKVCIKNLSTIEAAKQMWGVESGKTDGDIPAQSELVGTNLYLRIMPTCPGGGTYTLGAIGANATCTLSASGHSL